MKAIKKRYKILISLFVIFVLITNNPLRHFQNACGSKMAYR